MPDDLRVIKTNRDIKQAFINLLQTKGFNKITVQDICQEALIGRSTFYHHYVDKYDLLQKMVSQIETDFDDLLKNRLQEVASDSLLTFLYQSLHQHKTEFLTLIAIQVDEINLEKGLTTIISRDLAIYLAAQNHSELPVSTEFIATLYANNVLTAIKWALEHDDPDEISTFMNGIMQALTAKYLN